MATTFIDQDRGFAKLLRQAGIKASVTVGVLTDEQHKDSDKTVAEIGMIHELIGVGPERIMRPWLRPVVDGRKAFIKQRMARVAGAVLRGQVNAVEGMRLLGFEIVRLIQVRIRAGIAPALKDSTIARKTNKAGQTKNIPLIFTAQFIGSITARAQATDAPSGGV